MTHLPRVAAGTTSTRSSPSGDLRMTETWSSLGIERIGGATHTALVHLSIPF